MRKINIDKVEELKQFIDYEGVNLELEIIEIDEIKKDGIRITLMNNEDGKIQFLKFYLTEKGLPFYKKFAKDAGIPSRTANNPMMLLETKINAKIVFVNTSTNFTKIVEVSEVIPL